MTRPLSNDLRSRLMAAAAAGMSCRAAADRFGVATSTAVKLARRRQGGDRRSGRIEAYAAEILALIARQVDITLAEIGEHLEREHSEKFAPSTIWRFLDKHDQTLKKTAHASERERADVASARQAWRAAQPDLDPAGLVFVDETGASTKMARLYGRSPRGTRCIASILHGHWKTTTFVGALRQTGT